MKKTLLLLSLCSTFLFTSCNEDDTSIIEPQQENKILNFATDNEMKNKIEEIALLKNEKETVIIQKILERNKVKAPNVNSLTVNKTIDLKYDDIKDDLEFYHNERLNSIYELRSELNFTSIQSIADEINSLKLLNPVKADELYSKYEGLLEQSDMKTYPTINQKMSTVINIDGKIIMEGELVEFTKNNLTTNRIADCENQEGVLANQGLYYITWHAGIRQTSGLLNPHDYNIYAQLASFVSTPNGMVLYPSWFFTNPNSIANFAYGTIASYTHFPASVGTIISNDSDTNNRFCLLNGAIPESKFVCFLNGEWVTIFGSVTF